MVDRLGWTLVHFVWEGAAVAALLALALLLTRRSTPGLRYGLALGTLVVLAALPIATFWALAPAPITASSGSLRFTAGEAIVGTPTALAKMPLLVGVWAVGVVLLSFRFAGTMVYLYRWRRRHTRPAPREEQAKLDALARRLGLRRRIALLLSDRIEVPSAWGVIRPVVVLPASLVTGLSPAQIEGILLHELAHVRRQDYAVNLLQGFVETALFYHPAVWWVSSVVRREREHLCDDVAVAALGDPMPYARALLHLEERRQAPRPALSAREGNLMNRIARILSPKPASARLSPLAPSLAALAVVGLALGGVLRAEAQAAPVENPTTARKARAIAQVDRTRSDLAPVEVRLRQGLARLQAAQAQSKAKSTAWSAGSLRRAQEELLKARLQLLVQQSKVDTQIARAETDAARKRLDEARHRGATYGVPGKAQFPVWSAKECPQGLGRLATPKTADASAQDWAAMQRAQAELAQGLAMQRKAILAAQGAAARARVKADFQADRAAGDRSKDRDRLIAEAKTAQVKAEKARADATQSPDAFVAPSPTRGAPVTDLFRWAQAPTDSEKKLLRTIADAQKGEGQVTENRLRTLQSQDILRKEVIASAHSIFGAAGQVKGLGSTNFSRPWSLQTTQAGKVYLVDPSKATAPLKIDITTFGNGFAFGEPKIELGDRGRVSVDAKDTPFNVAVRALARKAKLSVVIERGAYGDVSLVLSDRAAGNALEILCKAAGAELRNEKGVYFIHPRK